MEEKPAEEFHIMDRVLQRMVQYPVFEQNLAIKNNVIYYLVSQSIYSIAGNHLMMLTMQALVNSLVGVATPKIAIDGIMNGTPLAK